MESGHYHIKLTANSDWTVGYYKSEIKRWSNGNFAGFIEDDIFEYFPTRIIHPDQVSGDEEKAANDYASSFYDKDFGGMESELYSEVVEHFYAGFQFGQSRLLPPDEVTRGELAEDWITTEAKKYFKKLRSRKIEEPEDLDALYINDFAVFGEHIKSTLEAQSRPSDSMPDEGENIKMLITCGEVLEVCNNYLPYNREGLPDVPALIDRINQLNQKQK